MVAPAMDANMFDNPATQENVATLKRRGVVIAGPAPGRLASGLMGMGRLLETPDLLGYIAYTLGKDADLKGRKIVVSAGGTMEPIDPVRVITNHSSGKMGYAIAEAARDRGADVVLVAASTALPDPPLVNVVRVQTAQHMCDEVLRQVQKADALIMAAAVADYRPATEADQKIKKSADELTIELAKTTDILEAAKGNFVKVGFAAETQDLIRNARDKVTRKDLDLIVANDLTDPEAGFGVDTNKVTFIDGDLKVEELPVMTKYEVSQRILDRVVKLFPA
jgi:phosphopantothenoylcysteine decarboxylase/phosphopantothenate--cysteine ligase